MDSDQGKLFIGGISWETTEEKLKEHFSQYGDVMQTAVMRDKTTGRPRGFGFVVFSEPSVLDIVLQEKHTIDGRTVEAKRALSREEQQTSGRSGSTNVGRSSGDVRTKKIFVGGLPSSLTEDEFRQYFATFGNVEDAVIMYDQNTQRPRGFGFISFDAEDAVDRVLRKTFHDLNGKKVEVKRALPKDANIGGGNRSNTGVGGGNYQSYGGSGGNDQGYEDSARYMQAPGSGGGFPPYGSSGYSAPGYGYGANSGMGYAAGYGSYNATGGAAYGNPNVPSSGYPGPQSAARGAWSSQAPTGYGAMGYGGAAAAAAAWGAGVGAGGGGPGSGPSGQSPGAVAGYGSQGYGYSGYMGADGGYSAVGGRRYGSSPNNGARAGEIQGNSGGYGDANGNPGSGNAAWRADASGNYGNNVNGPYGAYGGGYNGVQARQAQQQ